MILALFALLLPLPTNDEPALGGLDPVQLCEGTELAGRQDLTVTHGRYTYRFVDEKSREQFQAAPERWGIQWGGGCGRMGPLSGVGDPERWTVHTGRIFIFASDGCREGFLSAPDRFVVPTAHAPSLPAAAMEAGSDWLARAVEAHGGEALDRVLNLTLSFQGETNGWTHELEHVLGPGVGQFERSSTWIPPDPEQQGFSTRWVLGPKSHVDEDGTIVPVTSPDQILDLRRLAQREPLALLLARRSQAFVAWHLGPGTFAGKPVENLLISSHGLTTTLHVDPTSARILGTSWRGRPNDGVTRDVVEEFTTWTELAGVTLPVARRVTVDGKDAPAMATEWSSIRLRSGNRTLEWVPEGR